MSARVPGAKAHVELVRRTWTGVTLDEAQTPQRRSRVKDDIVGQCDVVTTPTLASCPLHVAEPGYYILRARAKDARGNSIGASVSFYALDNRAQGPSSALAFALRLRLLRRGRLGLRAQLRQIDLPQFLDELHQLAARYMRKERGNHTLQPTALVHEAYLRLAGQRSKAWRSRAHFFAGAALVMRQILVDNARRRLAMKRGDGKRPVSLERLAERDAMAARV